MNRKQLILLIVLLAVLGGAGLLVQSHRNSASDSGSSEQGGKLLGENFPINDVTAINLKTGTNELNLENKDGQWRVRERAGYPADFSKISGFLVKTADLKILETEQVDASDLPRLELGPAGQGTASGTLLSLLGKDGKTLKSLTLGKSHFPKTAKPSPFGGDETFPDGRYVMLAGAKDVLLVHDALSEAEPKPEQWLNKDFFKIERPKAIAVTFSDPTISWQISRTNESGEWKLADLKPGQTENTTNLPGVSNPFASPSFDDVLPPTAKIDQTGLDKAVTVTVDTFDDFTYAVKVGKKNVDNYPISITVTANFPKVREPAPGEKPEDKDKADKAWADRQKQLDVTLKQNQAYQNWIYLVPAWSIDSLLKERRDLVVEPEKAKSAAEASTTNALPILNPDVVSPVSAPKSAGEKQ